MPSKTNPVPQAAAVPVADGKVCLVTSSNGKAWIIPKGMIDPGHTPQEAALQEAWEEAGLRGELSPAPLGRFSYAKWGEVLEVTVFWMTVTTIHDDWPEKSLRQRKWFTFEEARQRVTNEELKEILDTAGQRQAS
jgi:8-oxo-dGTP pyrophosphatase MutT (NUDIX family)